MTTLKDIMRDMLVEVEKIVGKEPELKLKPDVRDEIIDKHLKIIFERLIGGEI